MLNQFAGPIDFNKPAIEIHCSKCLGYFTAIEGGAWAEILCMNPLCKNYCQKRPPLKNQRRPDDC